MYLRLITLILLIGGGQFCNAELSTREILKRCDQARGNLEGVRWTVSVAEMDGHEESLREIHVQAKGFDMLAETLSPPRQKGHKLLQVKNNMFFYKPGLSKPVPVSLRQKLAGKAANGDIASTNYAEDYVVVAVEEGAHQGKPCFVYELEAQVRSVTYARIRYWVCKERFVGLRADYFTASGEKQIKTAEMDYAHRVDSGDGARWFISEMMIRDTLASTAVTRLSFSEPELGEVPARVFNVNAMAR